MGVSIFLLLTIVSAQVCRHGDAKDEMGIKPHGYGEDVQCPV